MENVITIRRRDKLLTDHHGHIVYEYDTKTKEKKARVVVWYERMLDDGTWEDYFCPYRDHGAFI